MSNTIKVKLPLALEHLIIRNNELLTNYRNELASEIEAASQQLMHILNLKVSDGWYLDMELMAFVREKSKEELTSENGQ